jgi:hypothetical protein
MAGVMVVELAEGQKILLGGRGGAGLSEVSFGDDVTKATGAAFEKGLATLATLFDKLDGAMHKAARRPDKVEMSFKASLTGECDLWIVSGEGNAEFSVTVTWER